MSQSAVTPIGSIFPSLLTVLFIGLKLTGVISWSWWWVLSPIWGLWVLVLVLFAIAGLLALAGKQ